MDIDEKFHLRWEFRRKEVGGDSSSDDDRSNTSGQSAVKRCNIVTDLVLLEDDEASDHLECGRYNDNKKKTLQPNEKKLKSRKKKQVNNRCPVKKENKRKMNLEAEEIVRIKGLKDFSESLIHELAVSRENMLVHMKDEMRELVARGMSRKKPKLKKNKTHQRNGVVTPYKNAKSNMGQQDACKYPIASDEGEKNDPGILEVATKNEKRVPKTAHMNFDQQVVSSPYLTLPTVISNPHFQDQSNQHLPSNGHIHVMNNSNPQRDIQRLIDSTKSGSFSHKSVGLFGQSCPQTSSISFPVLLSQGIDYGSNISSLRYCESPFVDSDKVVPGMNGTVRLPPSDQRFQHINMAHKSNGEFGSFRPQEVKDGQFYSTSLRNHR